MPTSRPIPIQRLHASPDPLGLTADAKGRSFKGFGGGLSELSPSPLPAPVGEGLLIDFLIEVRDHALDAGLGVCDALIVEERADFGGHKVEQGLNRQIADRLVKVLGAKLLQRGDGFFAQSGR